MAYDENLGLRVANMLSRRDTAFNEKRMFGGLGFMINDKMSIGIIKDELMIRVLDDKFEQTLGKEHVREMDFAGRPMRGFVYVERDAFVTDAALGEWVDLAIEFGKLGVVKSKRKKK